MKEQELDYEMLYEKTRVTLAKLAQREKADCPDPDPSVEETGGLDPISAKIMRRRNAVPSTRVKHSSVSG